MTRRDALVSSPSPWDAFPCLAMQLDSDSRLGLPAEVLRAVGWTEENALELVLVLLEPGLTLARLEKNALPDLHESLKARDTAVELDPSELRQYQVLADAYRKSRFKKSDGRLRLTEEILLHLGHNPHDRPWFFVQAGRDEILIMSVEYRNRRLLEGRRWFA